MNQAEKERLIKKDLASIENRVRHAFNQGYEMGLKGRSNCEACHKMYEYFSGMQKGYARYLSSDYKILRIAAKERLIILNEVMWYMEKYLGEGKDEH